MDPYVQAVSSRAREVCIVACAGSGKTTTLVNRIASKLNSGDMIANEVSVITFTVKAAEELRLRLAAILTDRKALSSLYIGTIHGFCRMLLTEFGGAAFDALQVLSEIQQLVILGMNRKKWDLEAIDPAMFESRKGEFFRRVALTFDIMKMERVSLSAVRAASPALASAFERYNSYLREYLLADYSDLIRLTVELFNSDAGFRQRVTTRASWLFVDEYQDVDPLQHRLLTSIAALNEQFCVIGDDDQNIYSFRGTTSQMFLSLLNAQANREVVVLPTNHRCRERIVNAGRAVAEQLTSRAAKPMAWNKRAGTVAVKQFATVDDEVTCPHFMYHPL